MNKWYIVGKKHFIDELGNSKYFKKDMGMSNTMVNTKTRQREMRKDTFGEWYYSKYKSLLFKSGYIGSLEFYIDYYLKEDVVGFFLDKDKNNHQYSKECNINEIREKGIDNWMGDALKELDETLNMVKNDNQKEINNNNSQEKGDINKVFQDPGNVSWKDIVEYQKRKNNL